MSLKKESFSLPSSIQIKSKEMMWIYLELKFGFPSNRIFFINLDDYRYILMYYNIFVTISINVLI